MRTSPELKRLAIRGKRTTHTRQTGFSLIELLIGMSLMAVALLSIATMFSTGYNDVHAGGRTTMATSAARQVLEDMQTLPFNSLSNLHGFNTGNAGSLAALTAGTPEYTLARKWRYALAGEGTGWPAYSAAERAMWSTLTISGVRLGVNGQISVVQDSPTLRRITVTVQLPARVAGAPPIPVQLATLISRL